MRSGRPRESPPGGSVSNLRSWGRSSQRIAFIAVSVSVALLLTACWFKHEEVEFSFENRTESLLCYYPSVEDAAAAPCVQEVEAHATTAWLPGCGYGKDADKIPVTVILTVKEGKRQIYKRTEECRMWQA